MTDDGIIYHLEEKYIRGRLTLEQFEHQIGRVLAGEPLELEPGEIQHLPPGPERLV